MSDKKLERFIDEEPVGRSRIRNLSTRFCQFGTSAVFWFSIYVAAVFIATAFFVYFFQDRLAEDHNWSEILRNIGLPLAAFFALGIGVWRSVVAKQQADIAERNLLNDRYQRAIELLGNENMHIRIGALRTLCALAEENPNVLGNSVWEVLFEYSIWSVARREAFLRKREGMTVEESYENLKDKLKKGFEDIRGAGRDYEIAAIMSQVLLKDRVISSDMKKEYYDVWTEQARRLFLYQADLDRYMKD